MNVTPARLVASDDGGRARRRPARPVIPGCLGSVAVIVGGHTGKMITLHVPDDTPTPEASFKE